MSNLIPLSELPKEYEGTFGNMPQPAVLWNFDLPASLDQDRLLFDANHLRRLQRISGSALTVISMNYDAKGEEYDASVQGINTDGSGIMGRVKKTSNADPSLKKIVYEIDDPIVHSNYGGYTDVHLLNKAAITDEVVASQSRKKVSREEAWGRSLDDHIQKSIRQSSKEAMVDTKGMQKLYRNFAYVSTAWFCGYMVSEIATDQIASAEVTAGLFAANYGVKLFADSMMNRRLTGNTLLEKRRWSILPESQTDRYLALNALTRINTIIKVRK